jgi:RHS repeat-associated protein
LLEFAYDALGRRIKKTVKKRQSSACVVQSVTKFVWDGWMLIAELDRLNSDTLLRSYVWGQDLSTSVGGAGGVGGLLAVNHHDVTSGNITHTYYVVRNERGDTVALVDAASQSAVAAFEYASYGSLTVVDADDAASTPTGVLPPSMANPASLCPMLFSTKYYDHEVGLYYYGYRYYRPETGTWLNRDPLAEEGGLNLYAMVGNDPINAVDPLGLKTGVEYLDDLEDLEDELKRKLFEYVEYANEHGAAAFARHLGLDEDDLIVRVIEAKAREAIDYDARSDAIHDKLEDLLRAANLGNNFARQSYALCSPIYTLLKGERPPRLQKLDPLAMDDADEGVQDLIKLVTVQSINQKLEFVHAFVGMGGLKAVKGLKNPKAALQLARGKLRGVLKRSMGGAKTALIAAKKTKNIWGAALSKGLNLKNLKAVASQVPASLLGTAKNTTVYLAKKGGRVVYVGITRQEVATRAAQHGSRFDDLVPIAKNLTRRQARALEQVLINNNKGKFVNKINSISSQ